MLSFVSREYRARNNLFILPPHIIITIKQLLVNKYTFYTGKIKEQKNYTDDTMIITLSEMSILLDTNNAND